MLPLPLYPRVIQHIAANTPFPCLLYEPGRLVLEPLVTSVTPLLIQQLSWLAVAWLLARGLYQAAVDSIAINGGWKFDYDHGPASRQSQSSIRQGARTSVHAALVVRVAFFVELVLMALNNFVYVVFWWALFQRVPTVRGHRLPDVAVLMGTVALGYGLHVLFAGGTREIGQRILNGDLDSHLARPKSALVARVASRCQAFGLGDVLSGLGLIWLFGELSPVRLPILLFGGLASAAVLTAPITLICSLTFWLGRVEAITRQLFETISSFSLYPERLFDGVFKWCLFTIVPAGFVGYVPARLATQPHLGSAVGLLVSATGYPILESWVFDRGLRRYASGNQSGLSG